jgi:predicted MPP superfamily phosphohydrolase
MDLIKWLIGFIGHLGLWCLIFNQIHATRWPRSTRKVSEKAILLAVLIPFGWIASLLFLQRSVRIDALGEYPITLFYLYACMLLGIYFVCHWVWRKISHPLPAAVIETQVECMNLKKEIPTPLLHGALAKTLALFPFNEALKLSRQRMTFELDVPAALDGLKICQLSDLHFTGQIGIEYFQRVVEEANLFEPDLIVITGDLVDKAHCLDWLEPTLGRLQAKLGVFYVLGNHDRRITDQRELRDRIRQAGLIQASGQWHEIGFNGAKIQITGNELPWYLDVNKLPAPPEQAPDLRILLTHSPDQIDWARPRDFNLVFAGHTHGGQIALPLIGPIVAPSKYGVRFASGTFEFGNTIMHVSRGLSGDEPIRFCSLPELGLFTIRSKRL